MNAKAPLTCSYIGRLLNSPSSSVAATGCLNKPGDVMELTIISKNNINKMFTVDFDGNTEVIKNPFGEEGFILWNITWEKFNGLNNLNALEF